MFNGTISITNDRSANLPGFNYFSEQQPTLIKTDSYQRRKRDRAQYKKLKWAILDKATYWAVCRASAFGFMLVGLGLTMATLGFFKDHFATTIVNEYQNGTYIDRPIVDHSTRVQFEMLTLVGPCTMAVGALVLMIACVTAMENREKRLLMLKRSGHRANDLENFKPPGKKRQKLVVKNGLVHPLLMVENKPDDGAKCVVSSAIFAADKSPTKSCYSSAIKPKISVTSDVGVENESFLMTDSDPQNYVDSNETAQNLHSSKVELSKNYDHWLKVDSQDYLTCVESTTSGKNYSKKMMKHLNSDGCLIVAEPKKRDNRRQNKNRSSTSTVFVDYLFPERSFAFNRSYSNSSNSNNEAAFQSEKRSGVIANAQGQMINYSGKIPVVQTRSDPETSYII